MKQYEVIKITKWYADKLRAETEIILNEKAREGYEVISVALGIDANHQPTTFITIAKEVDSYA